MKSVLLVVVGLLAATLLVLLLIGRGFASGRAARLLSIGRLSAGLSASWLGASLRRLMATGERRARIDEARRRSDAERIAATMGQMKGALMKLGQLLSFVSDDVPAEYRQALASLQAAAPPMGFPLVRDVAERELGRPLERAFARFDTHPLAAASIGQVHRATLPSGEEVVVKIQYPGVAEAIAADLANVDLLQRMIAPLYPTLDPRPVIEELRARLSEELDYRREAASQTAFAELYEGHPYIRIPRIIASHSTSRVLTSEYVAGRRFDEIVAADTETRSRYGEILYRFVFGSIIRFGVFNGDPHPGNYLFDTAGRMVFLDFGCVKYFPEGMLQTWRQLVTAHLSRDRDGFYRRLLELGFIRPGAPLDPALLYDYFGYFYEPWHEDREFTFSPDYNGQSMRRVFAPTGRFVGLEKQFNMPPDFVFVNRIQWGVYSLLSTLRATRNWHHIHRELLHNAPPSTELGELDASYRARWLAARGLEGQELLLTPMGVRRRAA
ncbi:MAG TPA: AarF/ABC1/UbiB kinase family protein [Polyangia bacterium]|nr:AarF/ABC1/UbiB kinase family protein [Polyangia bacterium]